MQKGSKIEAMSSSLETLVAQAKEGDEAALELVIRGIQDRVYGLAMRMLWHPEDARDASQEILIKIVTHLGSFRQEAAFTTWVYRLATNYLLTSRKRRAELDAVTFEEFEERLDGVPEPSLQSEVEHNLLIEEIRIGCTQGMLLCLDREHRIAYILGEIFEVTSDEGGFILDITPAAFRKRLSRARTSMVAFMQRKCGLVNPDNRCRCARWVGCSIQSGRVDPNNLLFAAHPAHPKHDAAVLERVQEVEELERAAAMFRTHPNYATPGVLVESIKRLISSGEFEILGESLPN